MPSQVFQRPDSGSERSLFLTSPNRATKENPIEIYDPTNMRLLLSQGNHSTTTMSLPIAYEGFLRLLSKTHTYDRDVPDERSITDLSSRLW